MFAILELCKSPIGTESIDPPPLPQALTDNGQQMYFFCVYKNLFLVAKQFRQN